MTVLQDALTQLDDAVAKMEGVSKEVVTKLTVRKMEMPAGAQPDMFGANDTYIDGAVVAQKLDSTIQKVEKLLEDA